MKKVLIIIGVILILAIAGGLGYCWYYTTTPQYSVIMALRSIKTHDWEKFQKYVDVDSLSESLIDEAAEFFGRKLEESGHGGILEKFLNKGLTKAFKPQLIEKFKESLKNFIESSDTGNKNSSDLRRKLLGGSSITCLEKEGKIAIVALNIKDEEKEITARLKMRQEGNHWQLIAIENPGEIVKDLVKSSKK